MIELSPQSEQFSKTIIVSGIPVHFTTKELYSMFNRWNIISVLFVDFNSAFIEFLESDAVEETKAYFETTPVIDPITGDQVMLRVDSV